MSAVDTKQKELEETATLKPEELVTLVSCDGVKFQIKREYAMASGTIRNMLNMNAENGAQFQEAESGVITFPDIKGVILKKICEYLEYKAKYTNSLVNIPEFPIDSSIALELLMAADYLDC